MGQDMFTFAVIVPTYNAGDLWPLWLDSLNKQSVQPDKFLVVDSSSSDNTVELSLSYGADVRIISPVNFNHGGTRNYAVSEVGEVDVVVFLTQDAILSNPDSLAKLVSAFKHSDISAVCGRQLPHVDANPLAKHAREFNYPPESMIKSFNDVSVLGLKTAFMSNSFAAYRRSSYESLGGFPKNTILAEDMYLAAKMILAGHKVAFCAEAMVYHSHNYTPWDEFRRYFDIGVFHACEPWIQLQLGGASGEGVTFVCSELRYLWNKYPLWIPRAILTTVYKFIGYKIGCNYKFLPMSWCEKLSMYKSYWLQKK